SSSRRRHTRSDRDWSSDVCSSDLSRGGSVVGGSAAPEILEDDAEPHIETVTRSAISAVQDVFAEELKEPWPAKAGAMPDADAREIGRASCRERVKRSAARASWTSS